MGFLSVILGCFTWKYKKSKNSKSNLESNDIERLSNLMEQKKEVEEVIRQIQAKILEYTAMARQRKDKGNVEGAKNMIKKIKGKKKLLKSKNLCLADLEQKIRNKIMNDSAEAVEEQYKISAVIIGSFSPLSANYENEILLELEEMRAEPEPHKEGDIPKLPDVPSDSISEAEDNSVTSTRQVSADQT